jgi:hypothetical protein
VRRRRRGGRGRDRGEGGEHAPHEASAAQETAQGEMFDHAARSGEEPRVTQPLVEARTEATQEQTPIAPVPAPAPRAPAAPVAFHEVSEHDAVPAEEGAHRPVRRRRRGAESDAAGEQANALQLVETQAEAVASAPVSEAEEEARRPVRRRRRSSAPADATPLQMVETAPGTEAPGDNPAP